ncbi:Epimerase family protein [Vibrio aerogenes CECT 7868]|uniref:Epimerase family protein n=1 Tax=Vibrio aerogenes CECT 7868 TaxID=1216006 RepID=A0A1M5Z087_9VIBR|nr:TIGR01777 family oxidoreductase [Vibrio aerogenes]SHI17675.1 Epimerase family protein [Vibrio aerogenes CECT 7868]
MRVLITGGSGLIGSELVKQMATRDHDIVVLTRSREKTSQKLSHLSNYMIECIESLDDYHDLNPFDAVINLAGEPIADKRWTKKQKDIICHSRWDITEKIVSLFHASASPPGIFISASAVGFYGDQQSHPIDEELNVYHGEFSHQVCAKWEEIAMRAESDLTRVCLLRTGVVLSKNGGALQKMLPPYRLGLGGPIGNGHQYMPWIHMSDMIRGILFLLETNYAQGPFNLCAPHPVSGKKFSQALASTLHRPHFLFVPKWVIQLLMGEASALLLDSIRAKPKKLTEMGFEFHFPHIESALKQILNT